MKYVFVGVLMLCMAACAPLLSGLRPYSHNPKEERMQLVVSRFRANKELGRYPLETDQTFALAFIHSVSKTPVVDVYKIRDGRIVQTKEIFETHGAGLPSSAKEPGGSFWEKNKDHFIFHMQRPIPKLIIRTNKLYQNRLIIGSESINLNKWDDQALFISVQPMATSKR